MLFIVWCQKQLDLIKICLNLLQRDLKMIRQENAVPTTWFQQWKTATLFLVLNS